VFPSVQDCIKSQRDFLNEFSKPEESFNGKDVSVWRFRSISTNSVNFFWKVKRRQRRNFSFFDFFLIYFLLRKHCWARIKMPDDKQTKKTGFSVLASLTNTKRTSFMPNLIKVINCEILGNGERKMWWRNKIANIWQLQSAKKKTCWQKFYSYFVQIGWKKTRIENIKTKLIFLSNVENTINFDVGVSRHFFYVIRQKFFLHCYLWWGQVNNFRLFLSSSQKSIHLLLRKKKI